MLSAQFNRSITTTLVSLLFAACACSPQNGSSGGATKADQIVRPLSDNVVVMEFNGGKITAKDLNEMVGPQIKRFSEEALEAYQQSARRILVQKLIDAEAKAQGKTPEALFESMMSQNSASDDEVEKLIASRPDLKEGLKKGFKDPNSGAIQKISKDDIKRILGQQKAQQNQGRFVEGLMAKANAKMSLELPRVQMGSSKGPFLGSANAKVQIHEFSDFQCPYCSKAVIMVKQIKDTYGDKVKLSFRQFPLDFHEHARPSALATICAHEQGKFWELHDKIFENQEAFSSPALRKNPEAGKKQLLDWAKQVGIDTAKLEQCMGGSAAAQTLQQDLDEAKKVGVNGTPSFFVNGKKVQAGSFEEFKAIVDEELARK